MTAPNCIFCAIVEGTEPCASVEEDERTLAFMDRAPANPGHVLVIPKRHSADMWDVPEEDALAVMAPALRVARRIQIGLDADGLNLMQATREAGFQDVFHFHVHVIPRYHGDAIVPPWPLDHRVGNNEGLRGIAERLRHVTL
jgi:histidine triad (HIT) family protein